MTSLNRLPVGKTVEIVKIEGNGKLRKHLLDMGVIPGEQVTIKKIAPMGDPIEIAIHGYELAIRKSEAELIKIKNLSTQIHTENINYHKKIEHPGLGEGGRFHDQNNKIIFTDNDNISFALVGNQNCGKTTLFNQLTGTNQHTGNFPGVTVSTKTGKIKKYQNVYITDLPGIYSLSPYSNEEILSRNFVLDEHPNAIINIVDATNIERNLYLTMQLLELNIPMVIALNMIDEVKNNHGSININLLENLLGVPVIPISAIKNEGLDELIQHTIHIAKYQEPPIKQDFCDTSENSGALHRCIHAITHLIEDHAEKNDISAKFAATKIIEKDSLIIDRLKLTPYEKETIEQIILNFEQEQKLDRFEAIASMRFSFIKKICYQTVIYSKESKERIRSSKFDKILTGKYTAFPVFICIMLLIFWLTFDVIGVFFQEKFSDTIQFLIFNLDNFLTNLKINTSLHLLITKGICSGIGGVIVFLPIIIVLFFFLSLLEDSGYMSRIAFFMDKPLRKMGLSGHSIVPMLVGFGCSVPAIMSTRTLPSEKDRRITTFLIPFFSCTAKLPIYVFFISAFFPEKKLQILFFLYFLGIFVAILISFLFKKILLNSEAIPFVMELPNYRLPSLKSTIYLLWEKTKDFLQKAFTVIFLATIIIWFLQSYDWHFRIVAEAKQSILSSISTKFSILFSPLGFGRWEFISALFTGLLAKESVVSTLMVLNENLSHSLTTAEALSFLVYCLLYTPCIASIAAINREFGKFLTLSFIIWQCSIAWIFAFLTYRTSLILFSLS
ncbi:MAG: ferrous iron transport protein B [Alphaproteobacteria bacterium]|nr:ferrous iron transport protein B [Alphaproteobacteria bacterium]